MRDFVKRNGDEIVAIRRHPSVNAVVELLVGIEINNKMRDVSGREFCVKNFLKKSGRVYGPPRLSPRWASQCE